MHIQRQEIGLLAGAKLNVDQQHVPVFQPSNHN